MEDIPSTKRKQSCSSPPGAELVSGKLTDLGILLVARFFLAALKIVL